MGERTKITSHRSSLFKEIKSNSNGKCKQNSWSTKNLNLGNAGYSLINIFQF